MKTILSFSASILAAWTLHAANPGVISVGGTTPGSNNTNPPSVITPGSPNQVYRTNYLTLDGNKQVVDQNFWKSNSAAIRSAVVSFIDSTNAQYLDNLPANAYALAGQTLPPVVTPWATTTTMDTNLPPWIVYRTVVATNDGGGISTNDYRAFPSLCYDAARNRLVGSYIAGYTHWLTNGVIHLVESLDGGKTWINDRSLEAYTGRGTPVGNLTALRDGSLLLVAETRDFPAGVPRYLPPMVLRSTDGGYTWVTNGFITSATNTLYAASNPILETPSGTWLWSYYKPTSPFDASVARSVDRGLTWTTNFVRAGAEESALLTHPDGRIFLVLRSPPAVMTSTNDGLTFEYVGAMNLTTGEGSYYGSYIAPIFVGNRLLIATRRNSFGYSTFWYSDAYPYYTNGWAQINRTATVSLYDAPVKLSETSVVWLSAFDSVSSALQSNTSSNAWVEAWVTAWGGQGWSQSGSASSDPALAFYRRDIPANGRATVWPNWGTIPVSPTNTALLGPISTYVTGTERMFYSRAQTNVNFGSSNLLSSIWQTGVGTFVWRSARTNGGNNRYVIDNNHEAVSSSRYGFSLKQYGGDIYFTVCGTGTVAAATYALGAAQPGDDFTTGTPHVFALRVAGENAYSFADGSFCSSATNSTGDKGYSTASDSWQRLAIGSYGNSAGGNELFLSDLLVFTNALTDAEIYEWMRRLR